MSAIEGPTVSEASRYCRRITRRRARNFYYGLKLAPEPQRSALFSIYAWMRRADDLVDGTTDDTNRPLRNIEAFRCATDAALAGQIVDDDPLWVALADTATGFNVHREALYAMLDGQIDDLIGRQYQTFDQVREYCYRVASAVGLICIEIWGYRDPVARGLAVDRGIAFQLTNILRDYKEDFDSGRVYLPAEDFARHDLTPSQVRQWSDPSRCREFILEQAERAKSFYVRSASLDRLITPSCRPALWAMTSIYRSLLRKIQRAPQRIIVGRRLRLSPLRKGAIALRARCLAIHDDSPPPRSCMTKT